MAKSTAGPGWPSSDSGGYSVQAVPAPCPTMVEVTSRQNPATVSQKLILLRRGKAMSGAPIISGTNQLPKPPISAGITMKKIMIRPCAVISTFHCWPSFTYCRPGCISSSRMIIDSAPPTRPAQIAKIRYSVPISLWLVEKNQRWKKPGL